MPEAARLALGTLQSGVNRYPILWALLNAWHRTGLQVQPFRSRAELASSPGAEVASGRPYRHVDAGLIFPRLCGHLLQQGVRGCDAAVMDGEFDHIYSGNSYFRKICEELDFAGVGILNVRKLTGGHLPPRPPGIHAIVLDECDHRHDAMRWELEVETLWDIPVLGWMPTVAPLRAIAESLTPETRPAPKLCRALGDAFQPHYREDQMLDFGSRTRHDFFKEVPTNIPRRGPRVALGIDEAMSRYFPENLEALAARGTLFADFSPLRGEAIPADAEIVYLADGCLHTFARQLSRNYCLFSSLQSHVASGGRIYAEGMGAALLARELFFPDGTRLAMAGVLPWSYRVLPCHHDGTLHSLDHDDENWLVQGCPRVRGYLGCTRLELVDNSSTGPITDKQLCLHAWQGAVASTVPLFFPAHPRLVRNLAKSSVDCLLS